MTLMFNFVVFQENKHTVHRAPIECWTLAIRMPEQADNTEEKGVHRVLLHKIIYSMHYVGCMAEILKTTISRGMLSHSSM